MGAACTICRLTMAGALDEMLRSGISARAVATQFNLSYDALTRHARNHATKRAPVLMAAPSALVTEPPTDPLDELVAALRTRALAGNPTDTREYRLALAAQSDIRHAVPPQRDLASEPEWLLVRSAMLEALEPYPDAKLAVADALGAL